MHLLRSDAVLSGSHVINYCCFICCVALCQYIEATKFRDGARGLASADEGNPHQPPPQNDLTSACSFNLTRPFFTALSFC